MACKCFARCEADCVCDHDWTPREVRELRAEIHRLQKGIADYVKLSMDRIDEIERLQAQRDSLLMDMSDLVSWLSCLPGAQGAIPVRAAQERMLAYSDELAALAAKEE